MLWIILILPFLTATSSALRIPSISSLSQPPPSINNITPILPPLFNTTPPLSTLKTTPWPTTPWIHPYASSPYGLHILTYGRTASPSLTNSITSSLDITIWALITFDKPFTSDQPAMEITNGIVSLQAAFLKKSVRSETLALVVMQIRELFWEHGPREIVYAAFGAAGEAEEVGRVRVTFSRLDGGEGIAGSLS